MPTQLERGPVLVRRALQYSLNIPAIRTLQRVGSAHVADTAEAMGIRFAGGRERFLDAGLAGALGTVEVRPLDLTSAYGTIANGGVHVPPRMILEIRGPDGTVVWKAPSDKGTRAISKQAAYLVTDILAGNTDRIPEPHLGREAGAPQRSERRSTTGGREDRDDQRRPRPVDLWLPAAGGRGPASPWPSGSGWATATTRSLAPPSPPRH